MSRTPGRLIVAALLIAALTGGATACTPADTPPPAPSSPSAASPTPTASGATLKPDGDAEDNLPLFTAVMRAVWKTDDKVKGRAYIDALAEAGFDVQTMQVTRDETSVGNPADSIQFSVLWKDECLVGQVGPSTKKPTAVVLPALPDERCLVGETREIDWTPGG
ncbi:DUF6993 domain-containing protein [Microbacterium sp. TNHR37B]|uniref:DUF6993 domain-containing protein n=1 Tax=Microbacterium sp. TNHR37B TaxID=1775956 RepID=UPI001E4DDABC|nr:hypothetical protein [Microbacterium sp. TNHR37B]